MSQAIYTLMVEDDFYARHWMEMMLRRDWRTRVCEQVGSPCELFAYLESSEKARTKIHVILIDTEIPEDHYWLPEVLKTLGDYNAKQTAKLAQLKQRYRAPALLFTGMSRNPAVFRLVAAQGCGGYVLKDEIRYSLAWAVTLAAEGWLVFTPGVLEKGSLPPGRSLILDGRNPVPLMGLSKRESDAARLAFLFSMERREMANELAITEEYSYTLVSSLFEKCGLNDILNGEAPVEEFFGDHPAVKAQVEKAISRLHNLKEKEGKYRKVNNKKLQDKETLAFHLMTLPHIEEVR